jgi:hypothetical protein
MPKCHLTQSEQNFYGFRYSEEEMCSAEYFQCSEQMSIPSRPHDIEELN